MKFTENKYLGIYKSIISNALVRGLNKSSGEVHHIIPKSLGGGNEASNLVVLTHREHFVCHLLLVKITVGDSRRKMSYAAFRMANSKNVAYGVTSRTYDIAKTARRRAGLSDIHKARISQAQKGIPKGPMPETTKEKLRGQKRSDETRQKLSEARVNFTGWEHSAETKEKIGRAHRGRPAVTAKCETCELIDTPSNLSRWHKCGEPEFCPQGHDRSIHSAIYNGRRRCKPCLNEARKRRRSKS